MLTYSDEAHRTQTNTEAKYVISKSDAKKTYGFAKYLRDSFPNATYVGFTGTPIDATLRVFGEVVVQYTMKQSLDDGSTVGIARLPGPREVQLDEKMAQACDEYYRLQAEAGANEFQIEKSKKRSAKSRRLAAISSEHTVRQNMKKNEPDCVFHGDHTVSDEFWNTLFRCR